MTLMPFFPEQKLMCENIYPIRTLHFKPESSSVILWEPNRPNNHFLGAAEKAKRQEALPFINEIRQLESGNPHRETVAHANHS